MAISIIVTCVPDMIFVPRYFVPVLNNNNTPKAIICESPETRSGH
jgi:hypothetical protein